MIENVINFEAIEWETPAQGLRFKSIEYNGKKLRIVEFSNDYKELEWCEKEHIGYVIEGELEIDFCGVIKRFKAGDGLFIPEGSKYKHRHKKTIKTAKLLLVEKA